MSRRLHTLKDLNLRTWIKSGKPIAKSDGGGLTFTLSVTGHATFVLRYRHQGKQREITLGAYPDLTLEAARAKASELRRQVNEGFHVAQEKQRKKLLDARATTFKDLAEDYMIRVAPALRESTREETRRYLDKDILPRLGALNLPDLNPSDVVKMTEDIAARSRTVARRAYEIVSTICTHGVSKHLLQQHPCAHLKVSSIIGTQSRRDRIKLTRAELRAMLAALPTLGRSNELAVKIILATCVRKSELIKAQWPHLDLEHALWHIPAENSKTGKPFVIPLPALVLEWFEELKTLAGNSEWVLPARRRGAVSKSGPISVVTLNACLSRLDCDTRDFSPHDLRSTARSYLSELGVDVIVAERCLNHALGGLVAVYDQHDYLEERRNALNLWAAFIDQAERAEDWNVIPMKKRQR
jgi:integrase